MDERELAYLIFPMTTRFRCGRDAEKGVWTSIMP
jgi:hypothetical protein